MVPGVSSTATVKVAKARGAPPCLPGIRAWPALPSAMSWAMSNRAPSAAGSSSVAMSRSMSSRTSYSERTTGRAFAERICTHRPGSEPAIRVVSRNPCPARDRWCSGVSCNREASREDITCGTWEISATVSSCSVGSNTVIVAPRSTARFFAAVMAPAPVSGPGQITHGMDVNNSPRAATGPDFSRPVMGWVPTYRVRSAPDAVTAARMGALTEAMSSTVAPG